MRVVGLVFALSALAATGAGAQPHHHPVYLFGGYYSSGSHSDFPHGIWALDHTGSVATVTKFCDPPGHFPNFGSVCMDWDNKNLVLNTQGMAPEAPWRSTICRYDVASRTWTSIRRFPITGVYPTDCRIPTLQSNLFIDQNGDYLFSVWIIDQKSQPTPVQHHHRYVWKCERTSGRVSTILTTTQLRPLSNLSVFNRIGKDIDTGRVLVTDDRIQVFPTRCVYPVWSLTPESGYDPSGLGTFNDGSTTGWGYGYHNLDQNVRTGCLEAPYDEGTPVLQLQPGSAAVTVVGTPSLKILPYFKVNGFGSGYDLQTAANPRYFLGGYYGVLGAWLLQYDVKTWTLPTFHVLMDPRTHGGYSTYWTGQFAFYRGRNIQSVSTGMNRWSIRLSCPQCPNKRYVIALGLSGVRPGVALPDGRRINLNIDPMTLLSMSGLLPGVWDPGPLTLDAKGEARAGLDLSRLAMPQKGLGIPIWIAVVVLDPLAPTGVAYLPDTYVMRI